MSTKTTRRDRVYRFDEFELDVRSAELRRLGEKVRLQEQPYRLLQILLEHPGEVVLREEIRKRLWPNDTVVEISHGINAAVLRLREALGESAEDPRRIETVARQGYRFRGEVAVGFKSAVLPRAGLDTCTLSGQTVGHFHILERIGGGGMGIVYRAQDLKLGRQVAIKFLPPELAGDPVALGRFEREARTASALNHPNVCTVYSVEDLAGQPAIVMEFLEGETIEARLTARGAFPPAEALAIATAIAAALEAAHRKGIVHRDLKPGNVVVTESGVKVLDFGLAKMAHSGALTRDGALVGTPRYMAPELLEGREADGLSDIYSFGVMLREMVGPSGPPALQSIVQRCTAAPRDQRWSSASDLKAALELARATPRFRVPLPPRRWLAVAAMVVGLLILTRLPRVAPAWTMFSPGRTTMQIMVPGVGAVHRLNLSPDGRRVAFIAGNRLFVRDLDSDQERYIEGSEGAGTPFWSPDGRWIAFTAGGDLKKAPAAGSGPPQVLCAVTTNIAGAWSPSGDILIGEVGNGILRVRESGGEVTRLTVPDKGLREVRHMSPQFLPDGHQFLYVAAKGDGDGNMLYASALGSEKRVAIMPVTSQVLYAAGHLLFIDRRQIMARAFDPVTLQLSGSSYLVGGPVATSPAAGAAVQIAAFSAGGKSVAYATGSGGNILGMAPQSQNPAAITVVRNWIR